MVAKRALRISYLLSVLLVVAPRAQAGIRVSPIGANVNAQGSTTVFLTFGGLKNQRPAEAFWCGEIIPAAPDLGFKCDPATLFGSLPIRFDRSTSSGTGGFTDIMSIPASVSRRAYQAAEEGRAAGFFYVRRFVSLESGPDEYVVVTCRLSGGGARVAFALLDVKLAFDVETPIVQVAPGRRPPAFRAEINYTGTGRLKGRWEVVMPGQEPPTAEDLLTEATLPIEQRGRQRRYAELQRFNVFLPPTGRFTLPGPDVARVPTTAEGLYMILLRVEASDDREADSNLVEVGAGPGTVHAGGVAGFPLPVLRYVVGSGGSELSPQSGNTIAILQPADGHTAAPDSPIDLAWIEVAQAAFYRIEIETLQGQRVLSALRQPGSGSYRLPPLVKEKATDGRVRWRVVGIDAAGKDRQESEWRRLQFTTQP